MKNYYSKKSYLEKKSALSFYYQKFLGFDKRLRRNIIIGAGLMMMIFCTGVLLALISLVQFGGSLVSEAWGDLKEVSVKYIADKKLGKDVENAIFHIPKND